MGTFAFALNGALTAVRAAHVDIVGVVTLGMITATGGGIIRDILLGALPPATFVDWRYLALAGAGGLIAFLFSRGMSRFTWADVMPGRARRTMAELRTALEQSRRLYVRTGSTIAS